MEPSSPEHRREEAPEQSATEEDAGDWPAGQLWPSAAASGVTALASGVTALGALGWSSGATLASGAGAFLSAAKSELSAAVEEMMEDTSSLLSGAAACTVGDDAHSDTGTEGTEEAEAPPPPRPAAPPHGIGIGMRVDDLRRPPAAADDDEEEWGDDAPQRFEQGFELLSWEREAGVGALRG